MATGESKMRSSDVEEQLALLISTFGRPSRTSPGNAAAYPFTRLRSDGVWQERRGRRDGQRRSASRARRQRAVPAGPGARTPCIPTPGQPFGENAGGGRFPSTLTPMSCCKWASTQMRSCTRTMFRQTPDRFDDEAPSVGPGHLVALGPPVRVLRLRRTTWWLCSGNRGGTRSLVQP